MTEKPKRKRKKNETRRPMNLVTGFAAGLVILIAVVVMTATREQSEAAVLSVDGPPRIVHTATPDFETLTPFERGQVYIVRGRYADAVNAFTTTLDIDPANADALAARANAYYLMGDYNAAVTDYAQLLDTERPASRYWYGLGLTYYELAERINEPAYLIDALAAAEAALMAAEREGVVPPDYHRLAGDIQYARGALAAAGEHYQQYEMMGLERLPYISERLAENE